MFGVPSFLSSLIVFSLGLQPFGQIFRMTFGRQDTSRPPNYCQGLTLYCVWQEWFLFALENLSLSLSLCLPLSFSLTHIHIHINAHTQTYAPNKKYIERRKHISVMFPIKLTHSHEHVTKCNGKALMAILLSPHSVLYKQPQCPLPHVSIPFLSIHVCLRGLCFSGNALRSHSFSDYSSLLALIASLHFGGILIFSAHNIAYPI